ncbi:hypothetical protein P5673_024407 [Acropora cervicornis]|uniref:Uncharacterized protein n=1 Tax=Acropora cervicornis TaxID=6130 RepID=A0AAD9Q485_ACRCE|nr:hypothetical protein P5673_024407 [Acropora cervicornis]
MKSKKQNQRLEDVHQETSKDASFQILMTLIMKGWPDNKHETRLCASGTLSALRETPCIGQRITADLKEVVQRCETCQQSKPALPKEPLMPHPIPRLPWQIAA